MKNMKRKLAAAAMGSLLAAVSAFPTFADTFTTDEGAVFRGSDVTSSAKLQAAIDYHLFTQPEGSLYKGSGQCWGYAERVRSLLGSGGMQKTYQIPLTRSNLLKAVKGCHPGTHLRITSGKTPAKSSYQHSVSVYKCTDDTIYWSNGNEHNQNHVYYHVTSTADFSDWWSGLGFRYIQFVIQPAAAASQNKAEAGAYADPQNGCLDVAWPSVRGASRYVLYRSSKKNGPYKKILTTKKLEYTDNKAAYGVRTYYRVKAQLRRGSSMSSPCSAVRRLQAPVVATSTDSSAGTVTFSWRAVPGAEKYVIYHADDRRDFGYGFYTEDKAGETTALSWTVPAESYVYFTYQICAVGSNPKAASLKTGATAVYAQNDTDDDASVDE